MSQLFSSIIKKLAKKSDDPELSQKTRKEKHVNFCRKESVIINENGDLVIDEADVASILRDDSFDNGYDTETETDIGRGKGYNGRFFFFFLAHAECLFVVTLQTCDSRRGGELTELVPWTWVSSERQWLLVPNIESRWVKRE